MLKVDLHLHTVASRHAYSTALEYINKAKELGMEIIGFSEHGPLGGSTLTDDSFFECLRRFPGEVSGIRILKGIEANIIGGNRLIDVSDLALERLDFISAGFHKSAPLKDQGKKKNTEILIETIESGKIDIITHPFNVRHFDIDITSVSKAACDNDVLLEVNLSYLIKSIERDWPELLEKAKDMIRIVKECGKKIIVGSDAHSIWEMGDDSVIDKIGDRIGLVDDIIINNYPEELLSKLNVKK